MDRRGVIRTAGGLALTALAGGCNFGPRPLLAADSQAASYPTVEALRFFAADLAARTNGRLQVEIYPSEQLGSQNDTMELAQFGGIDFVRINMAPLNVLVPQTAIPSLPFLFGSIAHMRRAMDGPPGQAILDSLADYGLIGLALYDSGARSIYTVNRPVRSPADMRGLKIRVQTSDLFVAMIEAMGGNATPMAYGEVYQGLVQRVIDGAENNFPSYASSLHFEVAPIFSLTRHVMAPEVFAMSRKSWERLRQSDREAVAASAKASVPVMRAIWDERVLESRQTAEQAGAAIVEDVDRAAFMALMEPVWDRFAATPDLQHLLRTIRDLDTGDA